MKWMKKEKIKMIIYVYLLMFDVNLFNMVLMMFEVYMMEIKNK